MTETTGSELIKQKVRQVRYGRNFQVCSKRNRKSGLCEQTLGLSPALCGVGEHTLGNPDHKTKDKCQVIL